MKQTISPGHPTMNDHESVVGVREHYEETLVCAMQFAQRYLPRDQALEIAHDVATYLLTLPSPQFSRGLIYVTVTHRLRNFWRSRERRTAMEGAYQQMWSSATRVWADPGAEIEIRELQDRIASVLTDMPSGMRSVFLLIREEGLSYKEAAARLGITTSTVHTQISRANALLRQCVADYRADAPAKPSRQEGVR